MFFFPSQKKNILADKSEIWGFVDTESSVVSLIKFFILERLDHSNFENSDLLLSGFGKSNVRVIGSFITQIKIDDNHFCVNVNVVSDETMNHDAILGTDFIKEAEITINQNGMKISKPKDEVHIMNVDIACTYTDLHIGNENSIISKQVTDEVRELISSYEPQKIK